MSSFLNLSNVTNDELIDLYKSYVIRLEHFHKNHVVDLVGEINYIKKEIKKE